MGALPVLPDPATLKGAATEPGQRDLPDYLPARMVNEFVYCPRLFFYEWVDGVFRESVDTVEGKFQHQRVDAERARKSSKDLPKAEAIRGEEIHSRSVTLASEKHRVIAKIDLVDSPAGTRDSGSGARGPETVRTAGVASGREPLNHQSSIDNRQSSIPGDAG